MFKIEIQTDNAAFDDDSGAYEIARILRRVAEKVEAVEDLDGFPVMDINGNRVGQITWKED